MRNHFLRINYRSIILLAICIVSLPIYIVAQTPKPTEEYFDGPPTITKDGNTTTTTVVKYVRRTTNGKTEVFKYKVRKVAVDAENHQTTVTDSSFRENGHTRYEISIHQFSNGVWTSTETRGYDDADHLTGGSLYRLDWDQKVRIYPIPKETDQPSDIGTEMNQQSITNLKFLRNRYGLEQYETPPPKQDESKSHSMVCPAPNSRVFVGYAHMNRDDGGEKVAYGGVDASYTRFFSDNYNNTDSFASFPVRQFGAGASIIYVTSYYEEVHFKIAAITVGPDLQYNWSNFSAGLFLHVGMLSDGFKYGDYKDHESNFTVNPGAHIEYRFIKKNSIGLALRPQFLLTKQDDKSKMNFLLSGGISMNFGCQSKK